MPDGVYAFTFPMLRESEAASRLKAFISDMLPLFSGDHSDDVLSEYITVLVCNGKSQSQAREDLEAFLGEQSGEFVACLWELLLKDFSQGKQKKSASEPTATINFGSSIEQGSSSRRRNDYEQKTTNATNWMNEKLLSATAPTEDVEAHVSPKVKNMEMLRQELINSPCRKAQPKEKVAWKSSGFNYSRKILRSVIVSATKQSCGMNPDKYEKSMDERNEILQKRPYLPERDRGKWYSQSVPPGGAVSVDEPLHQEVKPHVSVWDRLGQPRSNRVLDTERPTLPKLGIQADENKVVQQDGPAAYSEQHSETFQREVPVAGYRHGVFQSHKARQSKSGTIASTEPHTAYNLSRKRRYGIINPNSEDASVCEFSSVLQYKQAKEDVERPSLLSYQSDLLSEITSVKQKLQQLEVRIIQSKQLKKQKIGEVKRSPQYGELQHQQDVAGSKIIHVTNVHYAAKKEAISMFFSKCGAVENVTIVTDPVTRHPKGAAFVSFATKESVNKAIALSNTMFYSRPIKVSRHVIASGVMSERAVPQVVS